MHSSQPSPLLRLGASFVLRRPLNRRLRFSSRYCIHHCWWSDLLRQQLAHTPTHPGPPSPRASARFACLLPVELVEQTTAPSRTVRLSGALPDFTSANPLSRSLLIIAFSVHFQDCQALHKALGDSCSPNALEGNFSLVLTAWQPASRRDPDHQLLPCRTPSSIRVKVVCSPAGFECAQSSSTTDSSSRCLAVLRVGSLSCTCSLPRVQLARQRRASVRVPLREPYRFQPIRRSRGVMSPAVTGVCPGIVIRCRPFQQRTDP